MGQRVATRKSIRSLLLCPGRSGLGRRVAMGQEMVGGFGNSGGKIQRTDWVRE